jgi:mono/diheme cytochrome c family protein
MRRVALTALAALAVAVLAAACGNKEIRDTAPEEVVGSVPGETSAPPAEGGGEGDPAAGAEVFVSAGCGSCHTLADAGSSGTIGPNLDDSQPAFDLVVDRVTNGRGVMPPFSGQLSEQQINDVAAYVVQATSG